MGKKILHLILLLKQDLFGFVAQLGERRVRNAEVVGSNPIRSIKSLSSPKRFFYL